jgi:hypothetical protein
MMMVVVGGADEILMVLLAVLALVLVLVLVPVQREGRWWGGG